MFGVDFSELVVIFAVALIVLGPTRMPALVRKIGKWVGKARGMARQFREQLESEIDLDNLASDNKHTSPASTPAPIPELTGAPVASNEPASEAGENYPYGSYPYAEPPAAPPTPPSVPQPGDDTYSHAHAAGAAPMPATPSADEPAAANHSDQSKGSSAA